MVCSLSPRCEPGVACRPRRHAHYGIFHIDTSTTRRTGRPIEIEAHDGTRHAVALKPGRCLYEVQVSPWALHGLKGDWYASLFSRTSQSIRTSGPTPTRHLACCAGGWDKPPITRNGSGRWAGALRMTPEVEGAVERDPQEQHPGARLHPSCHRAR